MNRARWKDVERKVAAKLNEVLSDVGDLSPIERIPLLGREGPDLTVNELGLVINVKSRGRIPDRLFPRAGESMFIGGGLSVFRLEELAHTVNMLPYTATKSWKQLADRWIWMDKWTQQFQPADLADGELAEARYFRIQDGELYPCSRADTDTEGADVDAIRILSLRPRAVASPSAPRSSSAWPCSPTCS